MAYHYFPVQWWPNIYLSEGKLKQFGFTYEQFLLNLFGWKPFFTARIDSSLIYRRFIFCINSMGILDIIYIWHFIILFLSDSSELFYTNGHENKSKWIKNKSVYSSFDWYNSLFYYFSITIYNSEFSNWQWWNLHFKAIAWTSRMCLCKQTFHIDGISFMHPQYW